MSTQETILVVDDEQTVREMLEDALTDKGYLVTTAGDGKEALEMVAAAHPDIILLDNRMPGQSGIEVLEELNQSGMEIPVILMTAYGSTDVPIQAMKLGAFEYIVKPFKLHDLFLIINKASAVQRLNSEVAALRRELGQSDSPNAMIGQSPIMQEVYKTIGRVAGTDVTVLIQGESGTGKELVARAIHQNSGRQSQPFIKINCAAIPENLLETELFGHEKGAFTGAGSRRMGKFEIANRGTIFLDEIGEMSVSIQAKILRVLQDKEYERIGGNQTLKADVRIVAATNKDLKQAIKEGLFREDLFFRLNVVNLRMPPLRERMEDITETISYFMNKYSRQFNKNVQGLSKDALQVMMSYDWPGNVRELQNVCERAVVMATGLIITPEDLPYNISAHKEGLDLTPRGMSLREIMTDLERQVVLNALREHNWNRTAAAQQLGISRRSLYDKIKQFHLVE